jgi:class 3 adenylate cyclase
MKLNPALICLKLTEWAEGTQAFPFGSARKSRLFVWSYISAVKRTLLGRLELPQEVIHSLSKAELGHTEAAVRWRGHLPPSVLRADLDRLVEAASDSPTVVVVGDIRKSQDLMTYAVDPEGFSTRMVRFITTTRKLIAEHHGFFDRFTGDGFLVYFNEAICRRAGAGHVDCCLSFLNRELEFARDLFHEWSRTIRKLSSSQVGLAIGADYGTVKFLDVNHHLVAVGEAIVWATRLSDIAGANEIAINNLLFGVLDGKPGITFESRTGKTKAGEEFVARMLSFCDS